MCPYPPADKVKLGLTTLAVGHLEDEEFKAQAVICKGSFADLVVLDPVRLLERPWRDAARVLRDDAQAGLRAHQPLARAREHGRRRLAPARQGHQIESRTVDLVVVVI